MKAKEAVDNIEVGGRNCYKINTPISSLTGPTTIERPFSETPNGFRLTGNQNNISSARINNVINSNGWWTISFYCYSNNTSDITVDFVDSGSQVITVTREKKYYAISHNVTNHTDASRNFVNIRNMRWLYYYFSDVKIEKGNKPTDWTPAPEDPPSATAYLTAAMKQSTTIDGGLINSSIIQLGENGIDRAGINGVGAAENTVRIWAGSTFANCANAPFRVLQDGRLFATNAEISGKITATSGSFTGTINATSGTFTGTVNATGGTFTGMITIGSGDRIEIHTQTTLGAAKIDLVNGSGVAASLHYSGRGSTFRGALRLNGSNGDATILTPDGIQIGSTSATAALFRRDSLRLFGSSHFRVDTYPATLVLELIGLPNNNSGLASGRVYRNGNYLMIV